MPRSTSPTLESLLPACETQSTVKVVLRDGAVKYFTTDDEALNLGGNDYLSGLLRVGELKETLGQATNRVEARVSNVAGEFGLAVASDLRLMELADVEIKRLYRDLSDPEIYEWKHFFTGKAVNSVTTEKDVSFDVIPDITAAGTCIATETLSPANGWRFPETPEQSPPGSGDNPGFPIGGGSCFLAGTKIFTPFGQQAIEKILEGFDVYSFNERTREIEIDRAAEVFEHEATEYFELVFADAAKISVTGEHPFLSESGEWTAAADLAAGSVVWQYVRGVWQKTRVSAIALKRGEIVKVYNLTVERNHNYFANRFAVHNKENPEA